MMILIQNRLILFLHFKQILHFINAFETQQNILKIE
jgi:hypothetical protein